MSSPQTPTGASPNGGTNNHVATHGPNNGEFRVVRKRNRVPLSCAPCRVRKLKCDRSSPCEKCVKRGDTASCSYPQAGNRRKQSTRSSGSATPEDMQNRVERLENMLLTMIANSGSQDAAKASRTLSLSTAASPRSGGSHSQELSTPSQDTPHTDDQFGEEEDGESETDKVTNSFGVMHFNNNQSVYLGEVHWGTVLSDVSYAFIPHNDFCTYRTAQIAEVKNYFTEQQGRKRYEEAIKKVEQSKKPNETSFTGPAFILGQRSLPKFSELRNHMPGKDAIDRLMTRYFATYDCSIQILHKPSWDRAYANYWREPEKATPIFLGQLYALCGLAMQSYHREGDEPQEYKGRTLGLADNYRLLTQQCMLLFDYNKVEHAIIETYVLHFQSENYKVGDISMGVWILLRIIISLAHRMGLHRDSDVSSRLNLRVVLTDDLQHFPGISVFNGEMRRRLWTYIRLADILFSFQISLPGMIRECDTDTALPQNLADEDFDEDCEKLPMARPPSSPTNSSYLIAKGSISFVIGKIVEVTHSIRMPAYEDVMRLDRELLDAYHALPPHLQMKPLDDAQAHNDPEDVVISRYHLVMLFNKGMCVLHRKFLQRARENSRYAHSRRACIDAAVTILRYHHQLYRESQPGKRFCKANLTASGHLKGDFILAGLLIALDLLSSAQLAAQSRPTGDTDIWGADRNQQMLDDLITTRNIWSQQKDRIIEAFKAHEFTSVMLQKIESTRAQALARGAFALGGANGARQGSALSGSPKRFGDDTTRPEHSAAMTLGMLSSGALNAQQKPGVYAGPYSTPSSAVTNNTVMTDLPSASTAPLSMSSPYTPNPNFAGSWGGQNAFSFFNGPDMEMPANFDWVRTASLSLLFLVSCFLYISARCSLIPIPCRPRLMRTSPMRTRTPTRCGTRITWT